jgi:tripartite-type tricarboxylate transporter receptor subunit TctC
MARLTLVGRIAAALIAVQSLLGPAAAQDYPIRPVRMIVPFAAGGPSDVAGRSLADAMSKHLKQTVVIENIGGAGGNIGAARAAQAAPDGYTVMLTNISMAVSPSLYSNLAYDPVKDFASVGIPIWALSMLIARLDFMNVPFRDFLTYLKTNADKVVAATTGPGGPSDLCAGLMMKELGVRFTVVPYQGTGPAMRDIIAGRVDMMCDAVVTSSPQVKAGTVKGYGIVGVKRSNLMPDLPTLEEQGLPNVVTGVWSGLYAPKRTPSAIIERLSAAIIAAQKDPEFQARAATLGQEIITDERATPAGAAAFLEAEIARWVPLLKGRTPPN